MENRIEKKENQRVTLTRRLLLEALLQLLEKKHINDISVTELCRCAGINRATFYKHYATPNDIFTQYIDVHTANLLALQDNSSGKSRLQVVEESCEYIYSHADVIRLFIRNRMDESFFREIFLKLLKQSEINYRSENTALDEYELRLMLSFFGSGYYFLIRRWILEEIPKSPKEIAALLLRLTPDRLLE